MTDSIQKEAVEYVKPFEKDGKELLLSLDSFEIEDEDGETVIAEIAKEAHEKVKDLEHRRQEITKPLLEAKRSVDDLFRPAIDAYTTIKNQAKNMVAAWARKIEAEKVKALESGKFKKAAMLPVTERQKTVTMRPVWTWRLEEPGGIDKVPREYLTLDTSKIHIMLREAKNPETLNVPGIIFYQEQRPVMGR